MPIVDVEIVAAEGEQPRAGLATALADAAGEIFGTAPGRTWVRLRELPRGCYAENGGGPPEGVLPVFVTVLKGQIPAGDALKGEIHKLTQAIAGLCNRPAENVHVLYLPEGNRRVAFGGRLVER